MAVVDKSELVAVGINGSITKWQTDYKVVDDQVRRHETDNSPLTSFLMRLNNEFDTCRTSKSSGTKKEEQEVRVNVVVDDFSSAILKRIEDMFYYAQLRSQGEDALETRESRPYVPVEQIPSLLRSLGYFPSEKELENIRNELLFEAASKNQKSGRIFFEDFIKCIIINSTGSLFTFQL